MYKIIIIIILTLFLLYVLNNKTYTKLIIKQNYYNNKQYTIYEIKNILTPIECQQIIDLAIPKLF